MVSCGKIGFDQLVGSRIISATHMNADAIFLTTFEHCRAGEALVDFNTIAEDSNQCQWVGVSCSCSQLDDVFLCTG